MEYSIAFVIIIIAITIVLSVGWTDRFGAPWVPTTFATVHRMLELAEVNQDDIVYDLGCGDGRTLVIAARRYGAKAVGIEIDPFRYLWCQVLITVLGLRKRVKIKYGNFFKHDLSDASIVTCYLLQDTNTKLERKFKEELEPGTKVVSNTFLFSGLHKIRQDKGVKLYLVYA